MEREERKYAYPAVFKKNKDGEYTAFFWDFDRYFYVRADTFEECLEQAGFLLCMLVRFYIESWGTGKPEPTPIDKIELEEGETASFVFANLGMFC